MTGTLQYLHLPRADMKHMVRLQTAFNPPLNSVAMGLRPKGPNDCRFEYNGSKTVKTRKSMGQQNLQSKNLPFDVVRKIPKSTL